MVGAPLPINPFGYTDHRPFAAFGVELVYGRQMDGTLTHISEAQRGLACACTCPACGRTLIARKGRIKVEHFGHYGQGTGCGRNAETNAHIWAKEVLGREKRILLPPVGAQIGRETLQIHGQGFFTFAHAELEKILDDLVPDVVLTTRDGQRLLVEVYVTHACGPEKIAKLKDRGLATLEIDLSAWRKSDDREQIEKALIETAPRTWLYNRKEDAAEAKLRALIEQRAAAAAEAQRKRHERAAQEEEARATKARRERDAKVDRVRRALVAARKSRCAAGLAELAAINQDPDNCHLLLPGTSSCGFLVPNARWQAALLVRMIEVRIGEEFYLPHINLDSAVRAIDDCIHALFHAELSDDVKAALPPDLLGLPLPRQAVEDYLYYLCAMGLLQSDGLDGFEVHHDRAEALARQQARWRLRTERRAATDRIIARMMGTLPGFEWQGFDEAAWAAAPIPGFDQSLAALLEADQPRWSAFEGALLAVLHMVDGGETVAEGLGLPVQGAMLRAEERARVRRMAEADARGHRLSMAAEAVFGTQANSWLYVPPDADAPIWRARNGEPGLVEALLELEAIGKVRRAEAAKQALAAECRSLLKGEADKALGPGLTDPFLNNYSSHLQASPWAVCVDQAGLHLARGELDRWRKRDKRARRR